MRVLVADDEFGSRTIAQSTVQALGHECVVAPDGDEAWRLIDEFEPHVFVTDRSMPGADGLELCRRLRAEQGRNYVYIVLVTSLDDPPDILEAMRAGADDFVAKPLDPFELETSLLAAERVTALHEELRRTRAVLTAQASTDPLTGLRNRHGMSLYLGELHAAAERYDRSYAVALCDVDHFKRFNDTRGHLAGDAVLRTLAEVLSGGVREIDRIYRFGGEEFLLVFPEQTAGQARIPIERLLSSLRERRIEHRAGGSSGIVTMSIGIAESVPGRRLSPDALLIEADAALYEAKRGGRDRLHFVHDASVGA